MKKPSFAARFLATGLLAAWPGLASTIALPPASSGTQCVSGVGSIDDPFNCSEGGAVGQVTLSPFAGVMAGATAAVGSIEAITNLTYYFEVIGGTPGDVVPVLFTTNLNTSSNSFGDAFSKMLVTASSGDSQQVLACSNDPSCTNPSYSGTFGMSLVSGSVDSLYLEAIAGQISLYGPGTSSAGADPLIAIDPSFTGASNYSIVLSSGVANAIPTSTPEPSYLVVLIGLLGLWAARRRTPTLGGLAKSACLFLLLASAWQMQGSILPAAAVSTSCTDAPGQADSEALSCSVSYGTGYGFGNVTLSPFVDLSAQASWDQVRTYSPSVLLTLKYYFEVVGGTPGDQVPLLISTALDTTNGLLGYGFAQIVVTTDLSNPALAVCTDGSCGTAGTKFSGNLSAQAYSGNLDSVYLEVEVAEGLGNVANYSTASADPFIYVDPAFAGASKYSIIVSDGVGNGLVSAPEPGTVFLVLLAGPGIILFARQRVVRR